MDDIYIIRYFYTNEIVHWLLNCWKKIIISFF